MIICGLQKLSLIDYPNKIACTIFAYGCNFRCGFCHNPELVIKAAEGLKTMKIYSEEDILQFLEKRRKYLDGVCITGGEPLQSFQYADLKFFEKIKSLGYLIKIDTNGSFPEKLSEIISKGLVDYIALDLKASKEAYSKIAEFSSSNNSNCITKIEKSIQIISKFKEYEFRTTVLKSFHTEKEVIEMLKWATNVAGEKVKKYCLQGFKKSGKLISSSMEKEPETDEDYLKKLAELVKPYCNSVDIRV